MSPTQTSSVAPSSGPPDPTPLALLTAAALDPALSAASLWRVLTVLAGVLRFDADVEVNVRVVAEHLGMRRPNAQRAIARLVALGYLERTAVAGRRRTFRLGRAQAVRGHAQFLVLGEGPTA